MNRYDSIAEELATLRARGLFRRPRIVDGPQAEEITLDGRAVLNLSSNNYLGFANHPELRVAAAAAVDRHGFGSGASRLIVGNLAPHGELEARVASWLHTEAALIFKHQPPLCTSCKDSFNYDRTTISLTGECALLTTYFTVDRTAQRAAWR